MAAKGVGGVEGKVQDTEKKKKTPTDSYRLINSSFIQSLEKKSQAKPNIATT